jgi:tetratricopeptide (TPR) repeat protein
MYILLFFSSLCFQSDLEKGKYLFQSKKYDEAIICLKKALLDDSNNLEINELLGDVYGHQMKWDLSIFYYRKIIELSPKTANFHYKHGASMGMKAKAVSKLKALGMVDDIKLAFETAAKLDHSHIDTRWALVMFYIELPGILGGSEKKALAYAKELMAISKVDGLMAKGHIEEYFERYEKAEKNYQSAHDIGQSKTTFKKLHNLYLYKLKNKTKAQELYKTYYKK